MNQVYVLPFSRDVAAAAGVRCPVIEYDEVCLRAIHTRGLCKRHYERQRRTGSFYNQQRERGTPEQRFWALVERAAPDECWLWLGRLDPNGYGRCDMGGIPRMAHRVAWLFTFGSWPSDETLDHMCHNRDRSCLLGTRCPHRRCVNPHHLRECSRSANVRAAPGPYAQSGPPKGTHCRRGHLFSHVDKHGGQFCRACINEGQNRRYARNRRKKVATSI